MSDIAVIEAKQLKPLNFKQKRFVDLMVYDGVEMTLAYCTAYDKELTKDNNSYMKMLATRVMNTPNVNRYYDDLMQDIRESQKNKAIWTREIATEKLMRLIERAECDIYGDENNSPKQLTMARLNAIILPVKELNLMNGFNLTNTNINTSSVQIIGEAEILD